MRPEHGAGCGGDTLHIKIAGQQQGGGGVPHLLLKKVLIAEMGQVIGGVGMPQHVLNPSAFLQDAGMGHVRLLHLNIRARSTHGQAHRRHRRTPQCRQVHAG